MSMQSSTPFPAMIEQVLDARHVVINRGRQHSVQEGQPFLVYTRGGASIQSPLTGEDLGHLEIVKGSGYVVQVNDTTAIIEIERRNPTRTALRRLYEKEPGATNRRNDIDEDTIVSLPPEQGDLAKPI